MSPSELRSRQQYFPALLPFCMSGSFVYGSCLQILPTVLQVRTGAVDRGACIRELSQYQDEVAAGPFGRSNAIWGVISECESRKESQGERGLATFHRHSLYRGF